MIATGQIHGGLLGWGSHWLLVRCERGEIADLLIAELSKTSTHRSAFAALAKLEHVQVTVPSSYFHSLEGNFTIRAVTGGGPDDLGTMFSVYKDVSLKAKALCGYHNDEVCTTGQRNYSTL